MSQAIEVPKGMLAYERSMGILDVLALLEYSEEEITEAMKKALGTNAVEYRLPEQKRAAEDVVNRESRCCFADWRWKGLDIHGCSLFSASRCDNCSSPDSSAGEELDWSMSRKRDRLHQMGLWGA
jgi:hypothetical protein